MHVVQVNSRPILPGAAMFEAAQAAGASLGAHSPLPNAALQHAAIPAPLMLQKPQVTHSYLPCFHAHDGLQSTT